MAIFPALQKLTHTQDSIAKEKKWGKKCLEIMTIKGGEEGSTPIEKKNILNFHFDYLNPSLRKKEYPGLAQLQFEEEENKHDWESLRHRPSKAVFPACRY